MRQLKIVSYLQAGQGMDRNGQDHSYSGYCRSKDCTLAAEAVCRVYHFELDDHYEDSVDKQVRLEPEGSVVPSTQD